MSDSYSSDDEAPFFSFLDDDSPAFVGIPPEALSMPTRDTNMDRAAISTVDVSALLFNFLDENVPATAPPLSLSMPTQDARVEGDDTTLDAESERDEGMNAIMLEAVSNFDIRSLPELLTSEQYKCT